MKNVKHIFLNFFLHLWSKDIDIQRPAGVRSGRGHHFRPGSISVRGSRLSFCTSPKSALEPLSSASRVRRFGTTSIDLLCTDSPDV